MRVLITGSNGQLGKAVTEVFFKENIEVYPIPHSRLDISNREEVKGIFTSYLPDIVINCAAYTNVDGCEKEPEKAYRMNTLGPKNLAIISERLNIFLIHISTDYVFDGEKDSPYTEFDLPHPINTYGRSKLEGENFVKSFSRHFAIVRTSWLYGDGNNFVTKIIERAKIDKELKIVEDQFGSPTYTYDVAKAILSIAKNDACGLYHSANVGVVSRYEEARFIVENLSLNIDIIPVKQKEYVLPAVRPRYTPLENYLLGLEDIYHMRDWKEAMEEFLKKEMAR
ncbi:MAG: dTDP-4-dehydrorhamnose reductase [bacterium]